MNDALFDLLQQMIYKITGIKEITYDTDFIKDLALSSFDIMNIINAFEEKFDVDIPTRDVWQLHRVRDAVDYMQRNYPDVLE